MSSSYSPEPAMSMSPPPSSPRRELIPILHASHQVVLYNPTSHAVSIREHSPVGAVVPVKSASRALFCPYCDRPFDDDDDVGADGQSAGRGRPGNGVSSRGFNSSRAHNYFQLLEISNESSRPSTPFVARSPDVNGAAYSAGSSTRSVGGGGGAPATAIHSENMAEGYFSAFFREECRLGMGANGSVYLCQHVLHGNHLGRFAVKKIAVGQSQDYLVNALREVRLLETLHHPNIVIYHHSWLETCQFSTFGPPVPTLFVLMQWAEGGSLDDFIRMRLGIPVSQSTLNASGQLQMQDSEEEPRSRSARIRAFRAAQARPEVRRAQRSDSQQAERGRAIHFLNAMEVKSIFNDVVSGLGFLHAKSTLHLDLKPGNVLLTYDEGRLIPRAMLSDFGTYQDMLRPHRARTGITGTLEYTAPESLSIETRPSSKADMWSLGMILHILLFFRLPYDHVEDSDISKLEREVLNYKGFKPSLEVTAACKRRGVPRQALIVLEELLAINPRARPSCEQILSVLREGKLDPLNRDSISDEERNSLVPVVSPQAHTHTHHNNVHIHGLGSSSSHSSLLSPLSPPPLLRAIRIHRHDSDSATNSSLSSDADSSSYDELGMDWERRTKPKTKPLLSLPAPPSPSPPPELESESDLELKAKSSKSRFMVYSRRMGEWMDAKVLGPLQVVIPSPVTRLVREVYQQHYGKLFKSSVLLLKIMSLSQLCRVVPARPIVLCGVVILAILDMWTDRFSTSAALGLLHLGILGLGRSRCCMY